MAEDGGDRQEEDLQVEDQRLMVNVPDVVAELLIP